jgi:hypothetical protein
VRIVAVLLTRDQVELVDAVVAFHLAAGVDLVIAVDHESSDGTAEILERYEREGRLLLVRREGTSIELLREEMARLAFAEHGADWVLHPDGDEFWWPRGGSWKEILARVPRGYGVVRGAWRHFAPRPPADGHFAERLVVRVSPSASRTSEADPFHAGAKVAHRGSPEVVLRIAAHDAELPGRRPLRGWFPFEILHFPLRSREQGRAKYARLVAGLSAGALLVPPHVRQAGEDITTGRWDARYDGLVVDDAALEAGLAAGTLELDTRLRDALRGLAGVRVLAADARFPSGESVPSTTFEVGDVTEQIRHADWNQVLLGRESDVRFAERLATLESRVDALESPVASALGTRGVRRAARLLDRGVRLRRGSGGRS